jgi:hypothetical protein
MDREQGWENMMVLTSLEQPAALIRSRTFYSEELLKAPHRDERHRPDLRHLNVALLNQHVELRPTHTGQAAGFPDPHVQGASTCIRVTGTFG